MAAQSFVRTNQSSHVIRHVVQRGGLARHHVGVEAGRTPHGLTRVIDDEVETRARGEQLAAEGLDAGRMAQVEAEDLEAMTPFSKVRLTGVTRRRIPWEARSHDQVRTAAQQLESRLVADLHAPAGEQRDAATEIGQLGALTEVQLRARRTQLIVEVMNQRVLLLADVAVLELAGLWALGFGLWALGFWLWAFGLSALAPGLSAFGVVDVLRREAVGH